MAKRISELSPLGTVSGDELLEVSVPDDSSDTGYVTRRVTASQLGGIPFRFPIQFEYEALDSELTFGVTFNLNEFDEIKLDSEGSGEVLNMHFNFVGRTELDDGIIRRTAVVCDSQVLYNGTYLGTSKSRFGSYDTATDGNIYYLPETTPPDNDLAGPILQAFPTFINRDFGDTQSITVYFKLLIPTDVWWVPNLLFVRGYADITAML